MPATQGGETSWEEIDAPESQTFWGVFLADDYTPVPLAIFKDEHDAEEWVACKSARAGAGDPHGFHIGDPAFMAVRGLAGKCWNSVDPPPQEGP